MPSALADGGTYTSVSRTRQQPRIYWYMAAVLAVTTVGFWPTFFRRLGQTDAAHIIHGASAMLWVALIGVQSWLAERRLRHWHRRVAVVAVVVLLVLVGSAMHMVGVMQHNPAMPPAVRRYFAFLDLLTMGWLLLLVGLGLANRRRPAAHWRFMTATATLGLPAALTRLYCLVLFPTLNPLVAFHASLFTVEAILVSGIVADRRLERQPLAYPMTLAFFVAVQLLIGPASASGWWERAMAWYGGLAMFR